MSDALPKEGWAAVGVIAAAALGGFWTWITKRAGSPSDMQTAATDFQKALNLQANAFIAALQADRAGLEEVVIRLRDELQDVKAGMGAELASLRLSEERCTSENNSLRQLVEAMSRQMERAGFATPKLSEVPNIPGLMALTASEANWSVAPEDAKNA